MKDARVLILILSLIGIGCFSIKVFNPKAYQVTQLKKIIQNQSKEIQLQNNLIKEQSECIEKQDKTIQNCIKTMKTMKTMKTQRIYLLNQQSKCPDCKENENQLTSNWSH